MEIEIKTVVENVLESKKDEFLVYMKYWTSGNYFTNKRIHHSGFPIIMEENDEFFRQLRFTEMMEFYFRQYLVDNALKEILDATGKTCHICETDKKKRTPSFVTTETLERRCPLALIMEDNEERVGIKYTLEGIDSGAELIDEYGIDEIVIIDWSMPETNQHKHFENRKKGVENKYVKYMLLKDFFDQYISADVYSLYVEKCRKAVKEAYREVGYMTITSPTFKNMVEFRDVMINTLENYEYQNMVSAKSEGGL